MQETPVNALIYSELISAVKIQTEDNLLCP